MKQPCFSHTIVPRVSRSRLNRVSLFAGFAHAVFDAGLTFQIAIHRPGKRAGDEEKSEQLVLSVSAPRN
jgi:hypothetical protein